MKYSLQKITLLVSLLFFVLFCFAFFFLYRAINKNNQKAETGIMAWQKEAQRRTDITALDRLLQEIAPDRALLQTHFAKSSDVVPFLDTIEALAPKAGTKAQVSAVRAEANNTGLVVELKAAGSFESLYKFLMLLENSPYELEFLLMDIQKTGEGVSDKTAKSSSWEADFKIKLLSFVP